MGCANAKKHAVSLAKLVLSLGRSMNALAPIGRYYGSLCLEICAVFNTPLSLFGCAFCYKDLVASICS
jgi:hypothetical protein